MRRVALVTWEELPGLSEDDRELLVPLRELGAAPSPAVWSDPGCDWAEFDAAVVRSTWDYHLRHAEFLAWLDRVATLTRLWNPPALVRWNSHKSYLADLARSGVPVVPTRLCADVGRAMEVARGEGWTRAVVKPAVSAAGHRTYLVDLRAGPSGRGPWSNAPPEGEVLVQPYLDEVERSGERSLVFLNGRFSHAFLRAPRLAPGSGLVEESPVQAVPAEVELGREALGASPAATLYARADMVRDAAGTLRLMELELIEPALGLRSAPGSARAFAQAIAGAVDEGSQAGPDQPAIEGIRSTR